MNSQMQLNKRKKMICSTNDSWIKVVICSFIEHPLLHIYVSYVSASSSLSYSKAHHCNSLEKPEIMMASLDSKRESLCLGGFHNWQSRCGRKVNCIRNAMNTLTFINYSKSHSLSFSLFDSLSLFCYVLLNDKYHLYDRAPWSPCRYRRQAE